MNTPRALLITAVTASSAFAVPGITVIGPTKSTVNVPKALATVIAVNRPKTQVPIRLPNRFVNDIALTDPGITGEATTTSYGFEIDAAPDCGGANACFVALFEGRKGSKILAKVNVTLARGIRGRYDAFTCGASCGPNSITWVQNGSVYGIQMKGIAGKRGSMIAMANQAITAGPR